MLEYLPEECRLGPVDSKTLGALAPPQSAVTASPPVAEGEVPNLSGCVITDDFEHAAKIVLPPRSWSYVSSSSNSGLSMAGNLSSWSSVKFRPRILRDVKTVSTKTSILGHESPLPFYISPMGLLGRAHENAEFSLVEGFVRSGIHGVISTVSTRRTEDIADTLEDHLKKTKNSSRDDPSSSQLHFQLYTSPNRESAVKLIKRAKAAGFRSLWVTIDTPVLGKRTIDRRQAAQDALAVGSEEDARSISLGIKTVVAQYQVTASLEWEDLKWIKEAWGGPLVLKGVQCAEDAKLAMEHGCQGILLSNHGGRQLHTAPDALTTLLEIHKYCPEVLDHLEVFVDGGLRDGSDVLKALCLGAKGVGVGRPFFYALAAYGAAGVERCVDSKYTTPRLLRVNTLTHDLVLTEELTTAMRLLGITSLDQVHPNLVNASRLLNELWQPLNGQLIKSRL